MNRGVIHKLAVLGKDYYSIRTIGDLFQFAGAGQVYRDPVEPHGSERINEFYGWVEGLRAERADDYDAVLVGVLSQMIENEAIPEPDRDFLRRSVDRPATASANASAVVDVRFPKDVHKLLERLILGMPRAMFPLKHRRSNRPSIGFGDEYDVQDLLHCLLRPWIRDIRPEEYTPSYAGSASRMDFLLPAYETVLEVKMVRDRRHGRSIGNELVLDIAHYQAHPACKKLWCIVYDPDGLIPNAQGLTSDLDGERTTDGQSLCVRTFILTP